MMSVGRGRAGSDVPVVAHNVAGCPADIGMECWGVAAVVLLCLWTSWLWSHWFRLTSVQAVKCVSNKSFVFPSPRAILPRWHKCTE